MTAFFGFRPWPRFSLVPETREFGVGEVGLFSLMEPSPLPVVGRDPPPTFLTRVELGGRGVTEHPLYLQTLAGTI